MNESKGLLSLLRHAACDCCDYRLRKQKDATICYAGLVNILGSYCMSTLDTIIARRDTEFTSLLKKRKKEKDNRFGSSCPL
jgi:hypothetical protein